MNIQRDCQIVISAVREKIARGKGVWGGLGYFFKGWSGKVSRIPKEAQKASHIDIWGGVPLWVQ